MENLELNYEQKKLKEEILIALRNKVKRLNKSFDPNSIISEVIPFDLEKKNTPARNAIFDAIKEMIYDGTLSVDSFGHLVSIENVLVIWK